MASNDINFEKLFLILRINAWWVLGILIGAILLAAFITYQTPKMYMATTSLNFDFSGNNPLDSRGRSTLAADSYMTTQVGILQSLNVAQQVVDSLTDYEEKRVIAALDANHSTIDILNRRIKLFFKSLFSSRGKEGLSSDSQEVNSEFGSRDTLSIESPYGWLAKALGSDLSIYPQVDSRIVDISYYSTDPEIAAMMPDRFAEAYIAANLKMVIDPARKTKIWFDQQLKLLRAQLEEAQAKLTAYQQLEGIVSSDQSIDMETANLRELAVQLAAAQQTRRTKETNQNKLNEVLEKRASLMTFEPVFNNSVVQQLKTDIRVIEGRLAEGANSLGTNHPKIKKLKSERAAATIRLNREIKTIVTGINNDVELSREREKNLEKAMGEQKQLVLKLKNEHDKIVVLQRDVESAQIAYNTALNQLSTTSMQSMVDQTNVSIIDHASIPSHHTLPRATLNLAVGAFGGLLLGIGFALFKEIYARRVYSQDDVVNELGIPLLGQLRKYS